MSTLPCQVPTIFFICANSFESGLAGCFARSFFSGPAFTPMAAANISTTNATAAAVTISTAGAAADVLLASVSAGSGGRVTIAAGGAIVDNNAAATNVAFTGNTGTLVASAAAGIGSAGSLETRVSILDADNTTSGNILIDNKRKKHDKRKPFKQTLVLTGLTPGSTHVLAARALLKTHPGQPAIHRTVRVKFSICAGA